MQHDFNLQMFQENDVWGTEGEERGGKLEM